MIKALNLSRLGEHVFTPFFSFYISSFDKAFLSALLKQWNSEVVQRKGFLYRFL